MTHSGIIAALLLLLLAAAQASADIRIQQPVYRCPRIQCAPAIDGRLDDPAWQAAPEVSLVLATSGSPASKRTTAKMCWDDKCLYIAFDCVDSDIFATLKNHDDYIWREEVVEAFICPDCDLRHYFEINLNPLNTVFDALIVNEGKGPGEGTDFGWTCEGLRTAVYLDGTVLDRTDTDRGWTAEYAIPFAALGRSTPKPEERWRLNLYRIDVVPEPVEFQAWSPTLTPKPAFHVPKRFGTVFFVE